MGNSQSEQGKPPVILAGTWETKGSETNMHGLSWPCQPYKFEFHGEHFEVYSETSKTGQRSEGVATRVNDREVELVWEWITDERKRFYYKGTLRPEYVSNCMLLEGCWGSTPEYGGHVAISGYYYFELHRVSRSPPPVESEAAILKTYTDRLRAEDATAEATGGFDAKEKTFNPALLNALAHHGLSRLAPLALAAWLAWEPRGDATGIAFAALLVSGLATLAGMLLALWRGRRGFNVFVDADVAKAYYYLPWWDSVFSQVALVAPAGVLVWAAWAAHTSPAPAPVRWGPGLACGAAALVAGDVMSAWTGYFKAQFSQLKWINFGPFGYVRFPEVVAALLFGVAVYAMLGSWAGIVVCFGITLVHSVLLDGFFRNTFPNYKETTAKAFIIPFCLLSD